MSRNIVLLSDGTGNSAAKVWRTNVWRTFEALDLSGNEQVAFYDDGVGTSSFKPWAILGGAFGFGLKRNVIDIYKFACRNYRADGDRIFGFGFSRGAFTIRVVGGFILNQGLVTAQNEKELDQKARAAYRRYRRERYHTIWGIEDIFRGIRDLILRDTYDRAENRQVPKIHFVGVWDTVSAYGAPLDEMTRGISRYIWPLELPTHTLPRDRVTRACQALALDEERTTFHPELWNEGDVPAGELDPAKERYIKDEQLSQVWFAGVHSNVGGGYPDDSLAYIPFVRMITEARNFGLKFKSDAVKPPTPVADPDTFKNAISRRDKDGRMYDPRAGLGAYYRYGPRKLVQLCNARYRKKEDDEVVIRRPKIHETVFRRIDNHAHAYAPVGLPPVYDVVREADGAILTPSQFGVEEDDEAKARADAQEHVWNEIWKRRIVYFATVGATLWLLVFPLVSAATREDEFTSHFRWVSDLIRIVGAFLPGVASTWIDGYARAPVSFVLLAVLAGGLMWWGTRIASRISVMMGTIWRGVPSAPSGLPNNFIYQLRSYRAYIAFHEALKRRWAPAFFAMLLVYLGACLASHLLFNVQDVYGLTCVESAATRTLDEKGQSSGPIRFNTSDLCKPTGIMVERGARYLVVIKPAQEWTDAAIPVPLGGFSAAKPPSWYHRILLAVAVPLRRETTQDWFHVVLRYGSVGGEETFIVPDPDDYLIQAPIRATRNGELFVFVNDAVIGIPGLYNYFYKNNGGTADLVITRR
ncbi:MAG TPA: DUF2235 domain-containing protein [Bradyrhizobium sp.]|nr:DUF2235 domain-containing protein [Bradyrhizobium sp.]